MIILRILSQNRRDLRVDFICEHCLTVEKNKSAYDDDFFHEKIVPDMKCKRCHNKAHENYRALRTRYHKNQTV